MIARVVLTTKCNRKCAGCSNEQAIFASHTKVASIDEVIALEPKMVVLTGGEVMMRSQIERTLDAAEKIPIRMGLVLYSATFDPKLITQWHWMLDAIDGLTFTLHDPCSDRDIEGANQLTKLLVDYPYLDSRLVVDGRVYDGAFPRLVELGNWRSVKKLAWSDECSLPDGEKLFVLE